MVQSLGHKIDKRCGPQFGPDKRWEEEGNLKELKGAGQHCHLMD